MNPDAPVTSTVRDMDDLPLMLFSHPSRPGGLLLVLLEQAVLVASGGYADRQRLRLHLGHQRAQLADHVAVQLVVVRPLQPTSTRRPRHWSTRSEPFRSRRRVISRTNTRIHWVNRCGEAT